MSKQKQTNPELDITEFVFLRDNLLVKAIRPKPKSDVDLVDPAQYEDKPEFGVVIKVGGEVVGLKAGDIIRFGKYSTETIRTNGEDYFIVREEDVTAHMPR